MIHGLLRRQARNRRQHSESVGGEEQHVGRMSAHAGNDGVVDKLQAVSGARILGELVGIEIQQSQLGIHLDVFEHGAEADRVPDLRLFFFREIDALGVAAAFEIENAALAPAVLVIANQAALRIGGKRGLTSAGEAEKQRHASVCRSIGGTVHGQHVLVRQRLVQDGEDALLHFTGVLGAGDDHDFLLEIENDRGLGPRAVLLRIGEESGCEE